ncbi:MAG: ribbon-helix-helix domain-containing protein [Pseudomonadales bacterium]|nr:ribbon-helix-helix domain-containing protein [Pseudomonadales bacterium]
MKTAISIPDQIFAAAEQTAKRLGISRSELYASAVRDYIESHVSEEITEKLNQVYSAEKSALDSSLQSMQSSSLGKEDW